MKEREFHKIICIRHGKPKLTYSMQGKRTTSLEFNNLLDQYDELGLDPEWNKHRVGELLEGTILSSDLLRAVETAELMTGKKRHEFEMNQLFREVPLPRYKANFSMSGVRLLMLARLSWFLGVMKASESPKKARLRVRKAADYLEERTSHKNSLLLFAHGTFLYLLQKELRKRGWSTSKKGIFRYLETAEFTKII